MTSPHELPTSPVLTPERMSLAVVQDEADGLQPGEAPRWEIWVPSDTGRERVAIGPLVSMSWALRLLALGQLATEAGVTVNDVAARVAQITTGAGAGSPDPSEN